jgi:hypothetical protein
MHDRLQSAILLNNVIKTILPRSIGLFGANLRFASIDYGKTNE